MPRIVFTADPKLPADLKHLGFKKGDEVELSEDHANRWLRRGVATLASEPPVAEVTEQASTASEGVALDIETATVEDFRAYLRGRGVKITNFMGEAKLRELAAAELAKGE